VRGIERRTIFRDDTDREDFRDRLAEVSGSGAWTVYAWALLPNHVHLLVRTGTRPLARAMRSLLTGYAGAFNRRHHRVGHLFQNRYKSIVVEEETYLLELVRYLHLNPLRVGIVVTLQALDCYPWTGHAALMGTQLYPWQETEEVLGRFARARGRARAAYRAFMEDGVARGRRPELQGGGLVRSHGGWQAVQALRRGREAYLGDERVLGGSAFVEQVLHEAEIQQRHPKGLPLDEVIRKVCLHVGINPDALPRGGRRRVLCRARQGIAYLWVEVSGGSGRGLADRLGVCPQSLYESAARGREDAAEWKAVVGIT